MEIEHFFICPCCWQKISMVIDLSVDKQVYTEDCEVCCRPLQVEYKARFSQLESFEVSEQ